MAEEVERISARRAPIRIPCSIPGHEEEYVIFKPDGWKFKHLRLWEDARGAAELAGVVAERIQEWRLLSEDAQEIPFSPTRQIGEKILPNRTVFDDLPPDVAGWLTSSFRDAYVQAGRPSPNA